MKKTLMILVFVSMFAYVEGQSWISNGSSFYVSPTTTNVAIGNTTASSKLEVRSSTTKQSPFRVLNSTGQTKIRVHSNGGVSIGNDNEPPVDGLHLENHFEMKFMKWMGYGPRAELQNRLLLNHTGVHGYIDFKDNLHFRADRNWISALTLYGNGSVGVGFGTTYNAGDYRNQGYKLAVNGGIICEEIKVIVDVPDADYVFKDGYFLMPLSEVEQFINENAHLPDIPSAESFRENGYKVGEMDGMLLRKIEELTLHIIKLDKEMKNLQEELGREK
jgi:hypothetical protein